MNIFKLFKISLLLLVLFTGVLFSQDTDAQAECFVSGAAFSNLEGNVFNGNVNLDISTNNCDEIQVKIKYILKNGDHKDVGINFNGGVAIPDTFFPDPDTGEVAMILETGEKSCNIAHPTDDGSANWGYDCIVYVEVLTGPTVQFSGNEPELSPDLLSGFENLAAERAAGILRANCDGGCGVNQNADNWSFVSIESGTIPATEVCILDPETDIYFNYIDYGDQRAVLTGTKVRLNVRTKEKCPGVKMNIWLYEQDSYVDDIVDFNEGSHLTALPPAHEDLWYDLEASEDECEGDDSNGIWDCTVYVYIEIDDTDRAYSTEIHLNDSLSSYLNSRNFLDNINFKKGVFVSECETSGNCITVSDNDWNIIDSNSTKVQIDSYVFSGEYVFLDDNSPCYVKASGNKAAHYDADCYEFLAPLPGIQLDANGKLDPRFTVEPNERNGEDRIAIRNLSTYQLGEFINKLFQIAIAMLGVLAVIMIVIAGVQYMTVESIYGKTDAKNKIVGASAGLILALGIFIILNTINPQLLEINFGSKLNIAQVNIDAPADRGADGVYTTKKGVPFLVGGETVKHGQVWPPPEAGLVDIRTQLETLGVSINAAECAKVGDKGCTSTYFESDIAAKIVERIKKIKIACKNCEFVLTGGSELWLHSSHRPNVANIDLRTLPALNKAISGKEKFIGGCKYDQHTGGENLGIRFSIAEDGACPWNPAAHWHLSF